jgi:hypothetical protein
MAPYTTLQILWAKSTDSAAVQYVKGRLDSAESDTHAWGADGVRDLVRGLLAGQTDGTNPLRASVSHDGTIWAFDPKAGAVKVGNWTQRPQATYRLVDVIDRDVPNPADRPARTATVIAGLWDLVELGVYGSWDEALAGYANGEVNPS